MLIVLGQVTHGVMHVSPSLQITPVDQAKPQPVSVFILVEIAVVEATLTTGNALPQLTDPLSPVDISTHLSTVEEERCMDVVPPILTLLDTADVTYLMVEDRIAFTFSDEPIQVIEYVLSTQPRLSLCTVIQINPDHADTGVAIKHRINVVINFELLLSRLVALIVLPTLESLLGKESTNGLGQLVQCLAGAQVACFILAQAGNAKGTAFYPNGLAGFLEQAQVPVVLIRHIALEQRDHLHDPIEVV